MQSHGTGFDTGFLASSVKFTCSLGGGKIGEEGSMRDGIFGGSRFSESVSCLDGVYWVRFVALSLV